MDFAEIKNKNILLDTNIILSCGDKMFGKEARAILRKLVDNANILALSEITAYEVLRRNLSEENEKYYTKLISDERINKISVSTPILINATILCRENHPAREKEKSNILCDMIIGGTVMGKKDALLLTSDRDDFREPYWKIISEEKIIIKKSEGWELKNIYLLKFDYCILDPKYQDEETVKECAPLLKAKEQVRKTYEN